MFINQPHSSSGGATESKRSSGSGMRLPPFREENKRHKWTVAFTSWKGFAARAASAETALVKPHEAPQQGRPLVNTLLLLEKVAQPLTGQPGNHSRGTLSMGQEQQGELPAPLRHTPEGSRAGKPNGVRNCPRAPILGHAMPQDQSFRPGSSVTSCPRVAAKLLLSVSLAFFG